MEQIGSVLIIRPSERRQFAEHAREVLARHVPPPNTVPPGHSRFDR